MDPSTVAARLETDEGMAEAKQAVEHAHQIGVSGVPCFIIEQKYGVSGAQDPNTLANAIAQIAAEKS
jgi:predicted DsbA family dithiol-disulfide isomerase